MARTKATHLILAVLLVCLCHAIAGARTGYRTSYRRSTTTRRTYRTTRTRTTSSPYSCTTGRVNLASEAAVCNSTIGSDLLAYARLNDLNTTATGELQTAAAGFLKERCENKCLRDTDEILNRQRIHSCNGTAQAPQQRMMNLIGWACTQHKGRFCLGGAVLFERFAAGNVSAEVACPALQEYDACVGTNIEHTRFRIRNGLLPNVTETMLDTQVQDVIDACNTEAGIDLTGAASSTATAAFSSSTMITVNGLVLTFIVAVAALV
eukprot:m.170869 g.170869  ORF g.170869 m.170869 type:complete len:265 (-) comp14536_c0_seq18:2206-3000(-)